MGTTALMLGQGATVLIEDQSVEQRVEIIRNYVVNATKFAQASLACQVMAGLEMAELKKSLRISQGKRTDLANFPNRSGSWGEMVTQLFGISDDTAGNWMKMAEGLKVRLKKLPGSDRLRELMALPPAEWSIEEGAMIQQFVAQATDGKTQIDFLCELGLAKKPKAKGGAREHTPKLLGPSEQLAQARALAESDWVVDQESIEAYGAKFCLLPDLLVEAQCAVLEKALQARREWLRQPQSRRDPQAIENLLNQP